MENREVKRESIAAWIGIDWADEQHAVCLRESGSKQYEACTVKQTPEALQDWINGLRKRFEGRLVAVALEQSRGPLLCGLMGCDFMVLYPINPKSSARYREALYGSGAKDDPIDAQLLVRFLEAHQELLRAWFPEDPQTRKLQLLVEFRRKLVDDTTALSNQLTDVLKGYYPQALRWVSDIKSKLGCDFLDKWPSLQRLGRVRPATVRKFYYRHNCRNVSLVDERLAEIGSARALTDDDPIVSVSVMKVEALVKQLRSLMMQIERFDKEIAKELQTHPDRAIFESLPGAGPALAPRLLVAMGTDRSRFESAREVQQLYGTAPVTERSGKQSWVHWRRGCPKFPRQSFVEFAAQSIFWSKWAAAYYHKRIQKGQRHHAVLRSLAYRWKRIIFRCWKDRRPYDEERYLQVLEKRNSPLVQQIKVVRVTPGWTSCGQIMNSPEFEAKIRLRKNTD